MNEEDGIVIIKMPKATHDKEKAYGFFFGSKIGFVWLPKYKLIRTEQNTGGFFIYLPMSLVREKRLEKRMVEESVVFAGRPQPIPEDPQGSLF